MPEPAQRVVVIRGRGVNPWELRPWELLPPRFDVSVLVTGDNEFDPGTLDLDLLPVRTLRDRFPRMRVFDHVAGVIGERYLDADEALAGATIVHGAELGYWFSADVARLRGRIGFRLVQTAWETLPMLDAYRTRHGRAYRRAVLAETDLFLATTERAAHALALEGVAPERVTVCPPGIDTTRFAPTPPERPPAGHLVLSPGRLVWEKGHQDTIRAVAALARGTLPGLEGIEPPRLLIVGQGPERERLEAHARELGVGHLVEIRPGVPYADMPELYREASCLVLASVPTAGGARYPGDLPHFFWEEQFGMVLAEALASGLPIVAAATGAIPEVCGRDATYFGAGDWPALARLLAEGPLARPPAERVEHDPERVKRFSDRAMADRLAAAYDRVVA